MTPMNNRVIERKAVPPAVPPEASAWYYSHWNGETYRAFRRLLEDCTAEAAIPLLMNMLTDAALERSGAQFYAGMTVYLYDQLARYTGGDVRLFVAAEEFLRRFDRYVEDRQQAGVKANGRGVPANRTEVVGIKHGGTR